jgi:hypothetical protein
LYDLYKTEVKQAPLRYLGGFLFSLGANK